MQEKLGVFKLLELAVMDLAVSGISEGFSFFEWVGTHSSEVGDNCSPKSPFLRLDRSQAAMPHSRWVGVAQSLKFGRGWI